MKPVDSRVNVLGFAGALLMLTLIVRLLWLQTAERAELAERGEGQRTRREIVVPTRGRILDRTGTVILVDNRIVRTVSVIRGEFLPGTRNAERREERIAVLAGLVGRSPAEIRQLIDDPRASDIAPIEIARDVPERIVVQLEERAGEFPGVVTGETTERVYPFGRLASHLLGYVGPVSENDLKVRPSTALYAPGQRIGRSGIEQAYEAVLRGQAGEYEVVVDRRQRVLSRREIRPAIAGLDVRLTIDVELQREAEQALVSVLAQARRAKAKVFLPRERDTPETFLRADAGAAVVLDVRDGSVLAMASVPDYDPQAFVNGISKAEFDRLNSDSEGRPLVNRAISGLYLPGSTFKLFSAVAALRTGVVTTTSTISDSGVYVIENCNPREDDCDRQNANRIAYGPVDLRRSLAVSSDVYYYRIGDRLWNSGSPGDQRAIQTVATEFGLGRRTGIALASEAGVPLPTPERRAALHAENPTAFPNGTWRSGDNLNVAIGQGDVLVTPLGLARAYTTLASGGAVLTPRVVMEDPVDQLRAEAAAASRTATTAPSDPARPSRPLPGGGVRAAQVGDEGSASAGGDGALTTASGPDTDPFVLDEDPADTAAAEPVPADGTGPERFDAYVSRTPTVVGQVTLADDHRQAILDGLVGAVRFRGGTARAAFAGFPLGRFPLAGKTGTAQQLGKHDSALFAGFGPVDNPKFAVVVVMEQAGYGGQAAAPVARRLFEVLAGAPRTPLRYAPRNTAEGR